MSKKSAATAAKTQKSVKKSFAGCRLLIDADGTRRIGKKTVGPNYAATAARLRERNGSDPKPADVKRAMRAEEKNQFDDTQLKLIDQYETARGIITSGKLRGEAGKGKATLHACFAFAAQADNTGTWKAIRALAKEFNARIGNSSQVGKTRNAVVTADITGQPAAQVRKLVRSLDKRIASDAALKQSFVAVN